MTDIVETLRQGSLNKDDYRWKAADEIEKLREQLETAYMYGHDMAKAEYRHCVQEVEGENDRLRAALELWHLAIKIDVTMEGPKYMGVSYMLGRQAWERTRDVLDGK